MAGRRRKQSGRALNGLLILDKPKGESSNHVLQTLKRLFKAAKAGHTGSLDPLATGLLPICFGEATKFSQFLLDSDKTYRVTAKLGIKTDTGDAEGNVIATCPITGIDEARLNSVLPDFMGSIDQIPPMYSALKHQGQPLYKLAREGIEIERKARQIKIYKLELLSFNDDEFELEVACSKGTYIRSLVEDIGEALGCGAHVTILRRLQSGPFHSGQMHTLDSIEQMLASGGFEAIDTLLQPMSAIVSHLPEILLDEATAHYLKLGQSVQCPESSLISRSASSDKDLEGKIVQIWEKTENNKQFLGIGGVLDDGRLAPRRLIRLE